MIKTTQAGAATHIGLVRSQNEDAISCLPDQGLFIVADGMGGHACGEVASSIAVETIAYTVGQGRSLPEAVVEADQAIARAATSGAGSQGMGTTIVVLRLGLDSYEIAWVGDSRAYRINDGIEQLTRDHSLVQSLIDQGAIDEDEAFDHPRRNVITRVLGNLGVTEGSVDEQDGAINDGDIFVLCTDGLHGLVRDEDIRHTVVEAGDTQAAAEALLKKALDAGGNDNISVIVVRTVRPSLTADTTRAGQ